MHELSVDVEEDEGDFSVQAAVFSQVDFSHAALAQLGDDFVMGERTQGTEVFRICAVQVR